MPRQKRTPGKPFAKGFDERRWTGGKGRSRSTGEERGGGVKKDHPKKPKNAYSHYAAGRREELKEMGIKANLIDKKMGKEWREMEDEDKKPYVDMAEEDQQRYEREIEASDD
ncbi:unnamed protein product [Vitrella brassicaformis CCMP3155]|uniref:HMG box domain-containing protein n=1 Tax=Vitrella brassicaformis (strain CCMP3155) TaxID=1169540 RepID=A0A0G4EIU0_VITBC|nr:unnamed protein product [Vitrella brassicaformis CCMP3155]|eukprot:CEL96609.1 unnamed protein product [Vitrella brassicaformis CCMP3155]